jgi:hypothetical protein
MQDTGRQSFPRRARPNPWLLQALPMASAASFSQWLSRTETATVNLSTAAKKEAVSRHSLLNPESDAEGALGVDVPCLAHILVRL